MTGESAPSLKDFPLCRSGLYLLQALHLDNSRTDEPCHALIYIYINSDPKVDRIFFGGCGISVGIMLDVGQLKKSR